MVSTRSQLKAPVTRTRISKTMILRPKAMPKSVVSPKKAPRRNVSTAMTTKCKNVDQGSAGVGGGQAEASQRRSKRKTTSVRKASTTEQRNGINIASILDLPLDLQLEVFSWLDPQGLVSLSRTNKGFRTAILRHGTSRIWELARDEDEVPEPPPAMSEQQWAVLLFGGTRCSECNAPGVHHIDFGIRKRVCGRCKRTNLVHAVKFRREYPEYDEILLEMVPFTNHGGSCPWMSYRKYYWLPDIYAIAREWAQLQDAIHRRAPDARKKADRFLQERKAFVQNIQDGLRRYKDWYQEILDARAEELYNQYTSRLENVVDRFVDLGYCASDAYAIRWSKEIVQRRTLTDRVWNNIRPILEVKVQEERMHRIMSERKSDFEGIFEAYLKTLPPREWLYHPSYKDVLELPSFKSVLNSRWDLHVTRKMRALLPSIPEAVATWRASLKAELSEAVLDFHRQRRQAEGPFHPKEGRRATRATTRARVITPVSSDPLNLATSVFACSSCISDSNSYWRKFPGAWFGWEGILRHSCHSTDLPYGFRDSRGVMSISEDGFAAASYLVKEVGLDPETATIEDMDGIGAKWFCTKCFGPADMVYDWRSVVSHAMSWDHKQDYTFKRLTDYQLKKVQGLPNEPFNLTRDSRWGCAHCDAHFKERKRIDQIKRHLDEAHGITAPDKEKDMVYFFSRRGFEPVNEKCSVGPSKTEK